MNLKQIVLFIKCSFLFLALCFYSCAGTNKKQNITTPALSNSNSDQELGRMVVKRNITEVLKIGFPNQSGTLLVTDICVDQSGNIISAVINEDSTTKYDKKKEDKIIKAIKGYKYEEDASAPEEECGKLRIRLQQVNNFD